MNKTLLLALAAVALCFTPGALASGWEIEAAMESKSTGRNNVTVLLQGDALRMDFPGTSTLINLQNGEVTTVMHEQKMFMNIPLSGLELPAGFGDAAEDSTALPHVDAAGAEEDIRFVSTGRRETISGFPCEEFQIASQPTLRIWFTPESPMEKSFLERLTGLQGVRQTVPFMPGNALSLPGFPVRVVSDAPDEPFTLTVLSVEPRSFTAADFAPPAGYQPFQLPPEIGDMLRQLQQANP